MKRILAFLLSLMLLCGVALADNPIIESVLNEHDVDVVVDTTDTIFTITPNGSDFSWTIYRLENGVWSPATETIDVSTPVSGTGTADGGVVNVDWDYWYNGDYTGYDGGVEHKIEVTVDGGVVSAVNFYVNYFINHNFDRVSLLSWFENEDGELNTTNSRWFPNNTANSFGPQVDGSWQTYSVVDLAVQGVQEYDLIAAGGWKIGTVNVTVEGDSVTVNYVMTEDINTRDTWDDITVDSEYLNIFGDAAAIDLAAESAFAFGEPISIANDLGGDTVVCVVICNQVDFPAHSPYVTRFWPNLPENKAIVDAMLQLLAQ